ncbi:MAG: hypothetical protein VX733_02835 [Candidatus Latescibacterota bacterium]|nr:hypothetical protein [Candidatus Latescibacterota bacterium]
MNRCLLAAFVGFSACSGDNEPTVAIPNVSGVNSPTSGAKLRQSVDLDGRYATGVRIEGDHWQAQEPAQEVQFTVVMSGMREVRQFELTISPDPPEAFDLSTAVFKAKTGFLNPFPSGLQFEGTNMRMGAANLSSVVTDEDTLGTFRITTASTFGRLTPARLEVIRLSIGPSSTQRDTYDAQELRLGVDVN